jgi:phytoene dehydrogenase-like protein
MKEAYRGPITKRPLALCDYSQIDSGLAPPGKSVAVICGTDYYEDWDGLDERAYRARKEDVTGILLDRLEDLVPGATGHLIYHELATAKTIERYTLNPRGSVYGYAQTPAQAGRHRFPNRTPVPGLYLASAWAMPGGGFTGAMLSGHFCAQAVLRAGHAGRLTPPPK